MAFGFNASGFPAPPEGEGVFQREQQTANVRKTGEGFCNVFAYHVNLILVGKDAHLTVFAHHVSFMLSGKNARPTLLVARAKRGYKSIRIQNIRDKIIQILLLRFTLLG